MTTPYVPDTFVTDQVLTAANMTKVSDGLVAVPWVGPPTRKVTAAASIASTDSARVVEVDSATDVDITFPPNMPDNSVVEVAQVSTGVATIVAGSGVVLRYAAGRGPKTPGQWDSIFCRKRPDVLTAAPTSGLIARFRGSDLPASGSSIAAWPDSAGLSLPDAVQATTANRPTSSTAFFGGAKAASFDGNNDFLSLSGAHLDLARNKGAITIFAIVETTGTVTNNTRTAFALSRGTDSATRAAVGMSTGTSGPFYSAGGRRLDADAFGGATSTLVPTANSRSVLVGRFDWTNSDLYLSRNGSQLVAVTNFQTTGNSQDTASAFGAIGAKGDGLSEFWSGAVAEVLVYTGNDSSGALRAQVEAYAQDTYGVLVSGYTGSKDQVILSNGVA